MNKAQLENKTGVEVLNLPYTYNPDDDTKINVKLPCGHEKLAAVKSLMKRTPKCLICNPRKTRRKKIHDVELEAECMLEECFKIIDKDDKDDKVFIKDVIGKIGCGR